MTAITLERVTKRFGSHQGAAALREVTLHIEPGSYHVIVGPTGCGKTTLLRIIAGLEEPTSGRVTIGGRAMQGVEPWQRGVGMVFQDASLYPHMTVERNLAFVAKHRAAGASSVDSLVAEFNLEELLDRKPEAISGGQRQRAALAKALAGAPSILLLDEPLAHLDEVSRRELRGLLARLPGERGVTVVHVTHDHDEALALADDLTVMCAGEVRQTGRPRDVYERPSDRFVGSFVGRPSMNLVPAVIRNIEGAQRVEIAGSSGVAMIVAEQKDDFHAIHDGTPVQVGIRPGDVGLEPARDRAASARPSDGRWHGTGGRVDRIEWLGDRALVHVDVGGSIVTAVCMPTSGWRAGDACSLAWPARRMHVFMSDDAGRRMPVRVLEEGGSG